MTKPADAEELRRRYADLSDEALAEAYAAGEANYHPAAWQVLLAEISSRHLTLAAPEQPAERMLPSAAWLVQRFLDAKWPLYVNTVFLGLTVFATHYFLTYIPSVAQRLLHFAALLAVAGLFLLGTWRRSHVVEGLVAAVYGYRVCLNAVRGIAGGAAGAAGAGSAAGGAAGAGSAAGGAAGAGSAAGGGAAGAGAAGAAGAMAPPGAAGAIAPPAAGAGVLSAGGGGGGIGDQ